MKKLIAYLGMGLLMLVAACTPYYLINNFDQITAEHKIVAVLPFEMIYTGLPPKDLSDADIQELEIAESRAFQLSFYNSILRSTRSGKKPLRITLQNYKETLRLLEENGIGVKESWYERSERLADILGVDAVVSARIEKSQYMSDLTSFGIDVANHILITLAELNSWNWLPQGSTISKKVQATYSLLNKDNGEVLWSISFAAEADWSQKSNVIIDNINRQGAEKFPYRTK